MNLYNILSAISKNECLDDVATIYGNGISPMSWIVGSCLGSSSSVILSWIAFHGICIHDIALVRLGPSHRRTSLIPDLLVAERATLVV